MQDACRLLLNAQDGVGAHYREPLRSLSAAQAMQCIYASMDGTVAHSTALRWCSHAPTAVSASECRRRVVLTTDGYVSTRATVAKTGMWVYIYIYVCVYLYLHMIT